MQVRFTRGRDRGFIEARRADGTTARTTIARGATPAEIAAIAKAGGHASSARAAEPAAEITELLQAERLVECFEAEMWSGCAGDATFRSILDAACSQSKLVSPRLTDANIGEIRSELSQKLEAWLAPAVGESLTLAWPPPLMNEQSLYRQGARTTLQILP